MRGFKMAMTSVSPLPRQRTNSGRPQKGRRVGRSPLNSHPEISPEHVCSIGRFSDRAIIKLADVWRVLEIKIG